MSYPASLSLFQQALEQEFTKLIPSNNPSSKVDLKRRSQCLLLSYRSLQGCKILSINSNSIAVAIIQPDMH